MAADEWNMMRVIERVSAWRGEAGNDAWHGLVYAGGVRIVAASSSLATHFCLKQETGNMGLGESDVKQGNRTRTITEAGLPMGAKYKGHRLCVCNASE